MGSRRNRVSPESDEVLCFRLVTMGDVQGQESMVDILVNERRGVAEFLRLPASKVKPLLVAVRAHVDGMKLGELDPTRAQVEELYTLLGFAINAAETTVQWMQSFLGEE